MFILTHTKKKPIEAMRFYFSLTKLAARKPGEHPGLVRGPWTGICACPIDKRVTCHMPLGKQFGKI